MKKFLALLLTLCMTLSLAAGALAEEVDLDALLEKLTPEQKTQLLIDLLNEAENMSSDQPSEPAEDAPEYREYPDAPAEEPPAYNNFQEHLQAWLGTIDLNESDFNLQLVDGQGNVLYEALLGKTENSFYGELLQDKLLGVLQIMQDAAYLSDGTATYGLKYETLQKMAEKVAEQVAAALGVQDLTDEQVQQDLQTVAGWFGALDLTDVYTEEEIGENEKKITLNAPLYAERYAAFLDTVLGSAEFADIYGRYSPIVSKLINQPLPSAAEVAEGWAASREQTMALLAQMELTVTAGPTGFTYNMSVPNGSGDKLVIEAAAKVDGGNMEFNCDAYALSDPDNKIASVVGNVEVGQDVTMHVEAYAMGHTAVEDSKVQVNQSTGEITYTQTVALDGQTVEDIIVHLNTATMTGDASAKYVMGDKSITVNAAFDGVKLTVDAEADGQTFGLEVYGQEEDASNYSLYFTVRQDGQEMKGRLFCSLVPMNPELGSVPEALVIGLQPDGSDPMFCVQAFAGPRSGDPALDQGNVTWITESMLEGLLQMYIPAGQPVPAEEAPADAVPEA